MERRRRIKGEKGRGKGGEGEKEGEEEGLAMVPPTTDSFRSLG